MALTAAQKKAIADANALIAKNKATLASIEAAQTAAAKAPAVAAKATAISAAEDAQTAAYQASLTAKPKTAAEQAALSQIAKDTATAITTGTALPAAAYTGVPAQPSPTATWNGTTWVEPTKGVGAGAPGDLNAAKDRILASTLSSYGLDGIDKVIAQIRADYPEISQDDLLTLLKKDPKYNSLYLKRFAGNATRMANGIAPLSDADYLTAEKEYEKIFKAYGVNNLATRDYYATLIGNRMDAADVSNRIDMAYQVYKGNPAVKNAFNTFYGTVTDGDVVAAMLDPVTQVPLLKKKITVAEIGGAALQQNLSTSLAKAQDLEAFGITGAQAQSVYSTIAQGLPTYEKILEMRTGSDVKTEDAQALLEQTKFKKNAQAIANEQAAINQEINRFGGTAGRLASKDRALGLI